MQCADSGTSMEPGSHKPKGFDVGCNRQWLSSRKPKVINDNGKQPYMLRTATDLVEC
jgi:hypothetical protein